MTRMPFGWTGVPTPVIGQGTWMMEGAPAAEQKAVEALREGIRLGMTLIDTAEMYGGGRVEELVGEAIAGQRSKVFLVTKVLPSNASYRGVFAACHRSLKRLGTEYIDLYLLHWPGPHPLAETMRAMEELINEGLIRHCGVSNFDLEELQAAERALHRHRLACNQVLYHLGDRAADRRVIPYCRSREIAVMGYSPFGHGAFPSPFGIGGRTLESVARKHNKTPRQVALRFLSRQTGIFLIPKSSNPEHVRENAGGAGWELDAEDVAAIDRAFPAPSEDVPLGML